MSIIVNWEGALWDMFAGIATDLLIGAGFFGIGAYTQWLFGWW